MEKDAEGQIKTVMLMGLPATSLEVKWNFSNFTKMLMGKKW